MARPKLSPEEKILRDKETKARYREKKRLEIRERNKAYYENNKEQVLKSLKEIRDNWTPEEKKAYYDRQKEYVKNTESKLDSVQTETLKQKKKLAVERSRRKKETYYKLKQKEYNAATKENRLERMVAFLLAKAELVENEQ
ncbi:hypothetical protein [Cetobacterium sp.]|uniref:hypothetical protein n=1 Tax=Cetobacterium sp. TaxID=2071632 RepID=UPI003F3AD7B1